MSWYSALGALVVGLCAGMLSGAVGVGGAVVSTPGIRLLGAAPLTAVGTTLPAILPSAAMGTLNYVRAGLVNHKVALICGIAGSAASVAGAHTSTIIGGRVLMFVTAGLVAENSLRMARDARRMRAEAKSDDASPTKKTGEPDVAERATGHAVDVDSARRTGVLLISAIGLSAGFVSGLLGVGGGIVMIPSFYRILRLPVKETVATSLLVVGILAIPGTVAHSYLGHIDWGLAGLLAIGVVPGAYIGSKWTVRTDEIRLRIGIAAVLAVIAVGYILGEIRSILAG